MNRNAKYIDVKTADGKLLLSLRLYDEETNGSSNRVASGNHANGEDCKNCNGNGSANGSKDSLAMSEAQKRYLFRILAERGFEGDDAHRHLKERFGANTLADVSKREASSMIEQLLEEAEVK
jgi:hypothetical protein